MYVYVIIYSAMMLININAVSVVDRALNMYYTDVKNREHWIQCITVAVETNPAL